MVRASDVSDTNSTRSPDLGFSITLSPCAATAHPSRSILTGLPSSPSRDMYLPDAGRPSLLLRLLLSAIAGLPVCGPRLGKAGPASPAFQGHRGAHAPPGPPRPVPVHRRFLSPGPGRACFAAGRPGRCAANGRGVDSCPGLDSDTGQPRLPEQLGRAAAMCTSMPHAWVTSRNIWAIRSPGRVRRIADAHADVRLQGRDAAARPGQPYHLREYRPRIGSVDQQGTGMNQVIRA